MRGQTGCVGAEGAERTEKLAPGVARRGCRLSSFAVAPIEGVSLAARRLTSFLLTPVADVSALRSPCRRLASFAAAIVGCAGWFLAPGAAFAYVRSVVPGTAMCLFWNERALDWSLQEGGAAALGFDRTFEAAQRSFDTWSDVACTDLSFRYQGAVASAATGFRQGGSNDNLLVFRPLNCPSGVEEGDSCGSDEGCDGAQGCWSFDQNVIAVTTTTFREKTGELLDADIEFNEANFDFTDVDAPACSRGRRPPCVSTDLQNTATHEIGHFFGLDHATDPQSTMFASAGAGETSKRILAADDRLGICEIYPKDGPTTVCSTRSGVREVGAGDGCGCTSANGATVFALLCVTLWLRRRVMVS